MKRSDTRIHQIELLLTLDYLLNYTDVDHPATQQDICRHARDFGLKYEAGKPGNDVRRQRIGDCLQWLQSICYKFENTDKIPFVINTTDSGKFYVEEKNHLNEDQIIKILAAVMNDKYTQDEDTDLLITKLLDSLSNVHNRVYLKDEVNKLNKGVKKYNFQASRKIRLVNKAFNEKKMIKIRFDIYDSNGVDIHTFDFWYRVYKIKEYKNKPHAILIPIYTSNIIFFDGYLFDTIENLNIPKLPDKDVLCEDFEPNRDLDKLFREKSKYAKRHYDSPEELINESVMPLGDVAYKTSFYFGKNLLKFVKPSFEEYFSINLPIIGCTSFDVIDSKDIDPEKDKKDLIIPHPLKSGEDPKYYVVNISINPGAFISWLVSDANGNGFNISDMLEVVGPKRINNALYDYYISHAKRMMKHLRPEDIECINKSTDRYLK